MTVMFHRKIAVKTINMQIASGWDDVKACQPRLLMTIYKPKPVIRQPQTAPNSVFVSLLMFEILQENPRLPAWAIGAKSKGATIHRGIYLDTQAGQVIAEDDDPNLNADTAVLVISREG